MHEDDGVCRRCPGVGVDPFLSVVVPISFTKMTKLDVLGGIHNCGPGMLHQVRQELNLQVGTIGENNMRVGGRNHILRRNRVAVWIGAEGQQLAEFDGVSCYLRDNVGYDIGGGYHAKSLSRV